MVEEKPPKEKGNEEENKKCPTAVKRMRQNIRQNARSTAFKSRIRTAIRGFEIALSQGEKEKVQHSLKIVYALMDKGVKRGIYKKNKAARVKSRVAFLGQKSA